MVSVMFYLFVLAITGMSEFIMFVCYKLSQDVFIPYMMTGLIFAEFIVILGYRKLLKSKKGEYHE